MKAPDKFTFKLLKALIQYYGELQNSGAFFLNKQIKIFQIFLGYGITESDIHEAIRANLPYEETEKYLIVNFLVPHRFEK